MQKVDVSSSALLSSSFSFSSRPTCSPTYLSSSTSGDAITSALLSPSSRMVSSFSKAREGFPFSTHQNITSSIFPGHVHSDLVKVAEQKAEIREPTYSSREGFGLQEKAGNEGSKNSEGLKAIPTPLTNSPEASLAPSRVERRGTFSLLSTGDVEGNQEDVTSTSPICASTTSSVPVSFLERPPSLYPSSETSRLPYSFVEGGGAVDEGSVKRNIELEPLGNSVVVEETKRRSKTEATSTTRPLPIPFLQGQEAWKPWRSPEGSGKTMGIVQQQNTTDTPHEEEHSFQVGLPTTTLAASLPPPAVKDTSPHREQGRYEMEDSSPDEDVKGARHVVFCTHRLEGREWITLWNLVPLESLHQCVKEDVIALLSYGTTTTWRVAPDEERKDDEVHTTTERRIPEYTIRVKSFLEYSPARDTGGEALGEEEQRDGNTVPAVVTIDIAVEWEKQVPHSTETRKQSSRMGVARASTGSGDHARSPTHLTRDTEKSAKEDAKDTKKVLLSSFPVPLKQGKEEEQDILSLRLRLCQFPLLHRLRRKALRHGIKNLSFSQYPLLPSPSSTSPTSSSFFSFEASSDTAVNEKERMGGAPCDDTVIKFHPSRTGIPSFVSSEAEKGIAGPIREANTGDPACSSPLPVPLKSILKKSFQRERNALMKEGKREEKGKHETENDQKDKGLGKNNGKRVKFSSSMDIRLIIKYDEEEGEEEMAQPLEHDLFFRPSVAPYSGQSSLSSSFLSISPFSFGEQSLCSACPLPSVSRPFSRSERVDEETKEKENEIERRRTPSSPSCSRAILPSDEKALPSVPDATGSETSPPHERESQRHHVWNTTFPAPIGNTMSHLRTTGSAKEEHHENHMQAAGGTTSFEGSTAVRASATFIPFGSPAEEEPGETFQSKMYYLTEESGMTVRKKSEKESEPYAQGPSLLSMGHIAESNAFPSGAPAERNSSFSMLEPKALDNVTMTTSASVHPQDSRTVGTQASIPSASAELKENGECYNESEEKGKKSEEGDGGSSWDSCLRTFLLQERNTIPHHAMEEDSKRNREETISGSEQNEERMGWNETATSDTDASDKTGKEENRSIKGPTPSPPPLSASLITSTEDLEKPQVVPADALESSFPCCDQGIASTPTSLFVPSSPLPIHRFMVEVEATERTSLSCAKPFHASLSFRETPSMARGIASTSTSTHENKIGASLAVTSPVLTGDQSGRGVLHPILQRTSRLERQATAEAIPSASVSSVSPVSIYAPGVRSHTVSTTTKTTKIIGTFSSASPLTSASFMSSPLSRSWGPEGKESIGKSTEEIVSKEREEKPSFINGNAIPGKRSLPSLSSLEKMEGRRKKFSPVHHPHRRVVLGVSSTVLEEDTENGVSPYVSSTVADTVLLSASFSSCSLPLCEITYGTPAVPSSSFPDSSSASLSPSVIDGETLISRRSAPHITARPNTDEVSRIEDDRGVNAIPTASDAISHARAKTAVVREPSSGGSALHLYPPKRMGFATEEIPPENNTPHRLGPAVKKKEATRRIVHRAPPTKTAVAPSSTSVSTYRDPAAMSRMMIAASNTKSSRTKDSREIYRGPPSISKALLPSTHQRAAEHLPPSHTLFFSLPQPSFFFASEPPIAPELHTSRRPVSTPAHAK